MSGAVRVPPRPGTFQARVTGAVFGLLAAVSVAGPVLAHGGPDVPPLDLRIALSTWSADPLPWLLVLVGLVVYLSLVRQVDRMHPGHPVPRWRIACWTGGLVAIALALGSFIDVYATTLFSVHMVQHLLLAFVAPPLLALGAPVTLLLRASPSGIRRRWFLPVLHSAPVRLVAHPVVAWLVFTGVMWATHFSPLFDAALEDATLHAGEHMLYLTVGLLFWWPVVAADPVPGRMGHAARIAYLGLAFPQNTFLGLAIFTAGTPLYHHYATLGRRWGPDPLTDQQLAGGIMWAIGDLLFIVPLLLLLAAWLRAEEARGRRIDAQLDREAAAAGPTRPSISSTPPATSSAPASPSPDTADGSYDP